MTAMIAASRATKTIFTTTAYLYYSFSLPYLRQCSGFSTRAVSVSAKGSCRLNKLNCSIMSPVSLRRSARLSALERLKSQQKQANYKFSTARSKGTKALDAASRLSESGDTTGVEAEAECKVKVKTTSTKQKRKSKPKSAVAKKRPKKGTNALSESEFATNIEENPAYLPRTRENQLKSTASIENLQVMGIDEAGRGPLAGPVVAAAAIIPQNIPGITDSKKLTKEQDREKLYELIASSPNAIYAIAVVDAKRIDEINILQATLQAMSMAATVLINEDLYLKNEDFGGKIEKCASSDVDGCYVVLNNNDINGNPIPLEVPQTSNENTPAKFHAIIDGNKTPNPFPCDCESMVKGDSKEYAIAAASIIAKVTRDRIMKGYDVKYPEYELSRHKGKYHVTFFFSPNN